MEVSGNHVIVSPRSFHRREKENKDSPKNIEGWARHLQSSTVKDRERERQLKREQEGSSESLTEPSNLSWIKAFRSQSRGGEVTIPCVRNEINGETTDSPQDLPEQPIEHFPIPRKKSPDKLNIRIEPTLPQEVDDNSSPPSPDKPMSAASIRVVQDYIDLASVVCSKTPNVPTHDRHVTVTRRNYLYSPSTGLRPVTGPHDLSDRAKEIPPIRSQYSGMDRDDLITLMAPKYHNSTTSLPGSPTRRDSTEIPSPATLTGALQVSISGIAVPTQSPRNNRKRSPRNDSDQQTGSKLEGHGLIGIGGDILERDSLILPPSSSLNGQASSVTEMTLPLMSITGTSLTLPTSPLKSARRQSRSHSPSPAHFPQQNENYILSATTTTSIILNDPTREKERERERDRPTKSREVHMAIPCTTFTISALAPQNSQDSMDSQIVINHSPRKEKMEESSALSLQNTTESVFVTENTQQILQQYLDGQVTAQPDLPSPIRQVNKTSRRPLPSQNRFFRPKTVTPVLQMSWGLQFQYQQRALRSMFQSQSPPEPAIKTLIPHTPQIPKQPKGRGRGSRGERGRVRERESERDHRIYYHKSFKSSSEYPDHSLYPSPYLSPYPHLSCEDSSAGNSVSGYGSCGGGSYDGDSEIQSVLNQMSRSQVSCDIRPIQMEHDHDPTKIDLEAIIDHCLSGSGSLSLSANRNGNGIKRHQYDGEEEEEREREEERSSLFPIEISPKYTPRLLLGSPRRQLTGPTTAKTNPPPLPLSLPLATNSVSLPVVRSTRGEGREGERGERGGFNSVDTVSLTSLSASVEKSADEMKKLMSQRILKTHHRTKPATAR